MAQSYESISARKWKRLRRGRYSEREWTCNKVIDKTIPRTICIIQKIQKKKTTKSKTENKSANNHSQNPTKLCSHKKGLSLQLLSSAIPNKIFKKKKRTRRKKKKKYHESGQHQVCKFLRTPYKRLLMPWV